MNTPGSWSKFHSGASAPKSPGVNGSRRLCRSTTATPNVPTTATGKWTSPASTTIDSPSATRMMSNTGSWAVKRKLKANRMTVSSRSTSHRPRVHKYRDRLATEPSRRSRRAAATPARKTNPGAQTCVIQRVRNRIGVVRARSSA